MTEIKYNNKTITSLEAGKTLTLHCAGSKMEGDISIVAPNVSEAESYDSTMLVDSILNLPGRIRKDASYLVASTCEMLEAGDKFPETAGEGDTYTYGDYSYVYRVDISGWEVKVRDNKKEAYGVILSSINNIGVVSLNGTFSNCTAMTIAPVIPEGVVSLYYTFGYCTSLTTPPTIPDSVTDMRDTFSGCRALTTPPVIPNGVTSLYWTFNDCRSLTTPPVIPNGVTKLDYAFYGCSSLTDAPDIPNSVTSMFQAFCGCSAITSISLASASELTTIGNSMCSRCSSLVSIEIPASITVIDRNAFKNCTSLTTIIYAGTKRQWNLITKYSDWISNAPVTFITCSDGNTCVSHSGGTATCAQRAVCDVCGEEYGSLGQHVMNNNNMCTICGATGTVIESNHSPYDNDMNYVVLGTWDYSDAKSVDILVEYQTQSTSYDWASVTQGNDYISGVSNATGRSYLASGGGTVWTSNSAYSGLKFGGTTRTQQYFKNSSFLTGSVIFKSNSSNNNYYGVKVTVIPNY